MHIFFLNAAHSFVELVEYVFTLPDVKVFLSQRVSQDPIENFFGCQRQCGGTHDNPNLQEFQKNMQTLRVVNSFVKGPIKGNCRGLKDMDELKHTDALTQPLPKRQRRKLYIPIQICAIYICTVTMICCWTHQILKFCLILAVFEVPLTSPTSLH